MSGLHVTYGLAALIIVAGLITVWLQLKLTRDLQAVLSMLEKKDKQVFERFSQLIELNSRSIYKDLREQISKVAETLSKDRSGSLLERVEETRLAVESLKTAVATAAANGTTVGRLEADLEKPRGSFRTDTVESGKDIKDTLNSPIRVTVE